ncbi:unnamed protein product, partial [Polarella glacialis]
AASKVQPGRTNNAPVCSSYSSSHEVAAATGFRGGYGVVLGSESASHEPSLAFDGDLGSFWVDLAASGGLRRAWIGIEFLVSVDIKCVRLAWAAIPSLHPTWSEVQAWGSSGWITAAPALGDWAERHRIALPQPSFIGWRRNPAPIGSLWRLANAVELEVAWEVLELAFFQDAQCSSQEIHGNPISSVSADGAMGRDGGHAAPSLAFDRNLETSWTASCGKGGCQISEAWIGIDAGVYSLVRCFRIVQAGLRTHQSGSVMLASWGEDGWQIGDLHQGLGGHSWNQRPVGADTMWRVVLEEQELGTCRRPGNWKRRRSWGISELELFADEACSEKLPGIADGAMPISNGIFWGDAMLFNASHAFDGRESTFWAASCGAARSNATTSCKAGLEWIGLDFSRVSAGRQMDVKCFRAMQSRSAKQECCDPASEVRLERWNGTAWTPATWARTLAGGQLPWVVSANFHLPGACPDDASGEPSQRRIQEAVQTWDMRSRRVAKDCEMLFSAATELMAEQTCTKHAGCYESGFRGSCCPVSQSPLALDTGQSAFASRCCCDFLSGLALFDDEGRLIEVTSYVGPSQVDAGTSPVYGFEFMSIRLVLSLQLFGVG